MKKFGKPFRHKMWTTLGIRSAEEIAALRNKDFEDMGFSVFDRKLLRREASRILAQGDRSTRIRRRLVNAISDNVRGDASLFARNLKGLFQAASGNDDKIDAQHMFESLQQAQIIDSTLLRESSFLHVKSSKKDSTQVIL